MFFVFVKGLLTGASLIIAIGLQNAFILRQGLKNQHVFACAITASLIDAALIAAGVLGFGVLIQNAPGLLDVIRWGGALFLVVYGAKSLLRALKPQAMDQSDAKGMTKKGTLKETILIILGVSLLNPHVYLDTVVLLGGLSTAYEAPGHIIYGLGAMAGSFLWFFSLAYGATLLTPLFAKPRAWQILDLLIALVMWLIALSLVFQ